MNNSLSENKKIAYLSDAVAENPDTPIPEPESILTNRSVQTYAGTLRPGIKVPFEKGKDSLSPKEKALYKKGILEGKSPREVESEIGKTLRPKNVPYFSVYRSECKNRPEHADLIRDLYGNESGEIHRLSITFLSDKWWEYLPHNLMAFRRSGLYCSSERIGGKLIASRDPEFENGKGQKNDAARHFKREKVTLPCIPDQCPIYQSRSCQFSGILHFLILGVPGTDLWRLPTTSMYSVAAIYKKLNDFNQAFAKKGKSIIGMPFELYKAEEEISRWDPERGRIRTKQWIIRIDCPELPLADLIVQMGGFHLEERGADKRLLENHDNGSSSLRKNLTAEKTPVSGKPIQNQSSPSRSSKNGEGEKTETSHDRSGNGHGNRKTKVRATEKNETVENDKTEAMTELRTSIFSELEPAGDVSMTVVETFLASVSKNRFEELSIEEANQLYQEVLSAKTASKATLCSICEAQLSATVEQFSMRHYGIPFCMNCQKKRSDHLPPQTQAKKKSKKQFEDSIF
ncbi:MAG: hypothetical protein ACE5FZ_09450 [Nitrospiria bacterium]